MDGARDAVPDLPLRLEVRPERDDRAGQVAAGDGPGRREVGDVFPVGGVLPSARCQQLVKRSRNRDAGHYLTCAACATLIRTSLSPRVGVGISLTEPLWPYLSAATSSKHRRSVGRVKMISEPTSSTVNARMVDGI